MDRNIFKSLKNPVLIAAFMLALVVFSSCEDFFLSEATNVDIPGSEPRLVVNSYISPQDSLINVWVHKSQPYTQGPVNFDPFRDIEKVQIREKGGSLVTIPFDTSSGHFSADADQLNVTAGKSYELFVIPKEGETVSAECSIPDFEINNFRFTGLRSQIDNYGNRNKIIEWRFTGPYDNRERFYRTGAYVRSYSIYSNFTGGYDTSSVFVQPIWIERGTPVLRDDGSGNTHNFQGVLWEGFYFGNQQGSASSSSGNHSFYTVDSVFITIIQSDIHYFQFHNSVNNYESTADGFPFQEPVYIYNNVKGGLGTFGGLNRRKWLVHIEISPGSDY